MADKLSEVVLSASNTSGLSATYITDVVTGEAKEDVLQSLLNSIEFLVGNSNTFWADLWTV